MQKFQDVATIIGPPGLIPIRGVQVTVFNHGTSTNATVYSDNVSTVAANPLTTDASGRYGFYVADGRYDLTVSGAGVQTTTLTDVALSDTTPNGAVRFNVPQSSGIRYQTSAGYGPFSSYTAQGTFSGTIDNVMMLGAYNITEGTTNTKVVASEPSFFMSIEADYNSGAAHYIETNSDYVSADGLTYRRFQSFNVNRATHVGAWGFAGNVHSFYKSTVGSAPAFNIDLTNFTDTVLSFRMAGGGNTEIQLGPATVGIATLFALGFGALTGSGGYLATNSTQAIQYIGATPITYATATGLGVWGAPSCDLDITKSKSGDSVLQLLVNTSNTANSYALQEIQVAGATAADAFARFLVAGATYWAYGIDNSDSDKFKISQNAILGTNDRFQMDISGNVIITGQVTASGLTAIPAGGTAGTGISLSSTANFGMFFGSGVPTLSAAKGSLYLRSDGSGTTDRAYINTNGTTTWTALTTVA